jgi:uncharacterized cysteine cluster protein YcgN (CxxCxxCC family)
MGCMYVYISSDSKFCLCHHLQPEDKETVKKAGSAWYKTMVSDSEYTEFENFTKWLGVSQ